MSVTSKRTHEAQASLEEILGPLHENENIVDLMTALLSDNSHVWLGDTFEAIEERRGEAKEIVIDWLRSE